jgi:MFS family permease
VAGVRACCVAGTGSGEGTESGGKEVVFGGVIDSVSIRVQGIGVAGMMPLGMALISAVFPASARGQALGTWSTVGPSIGFFGPLAAGFLVAGWGWRGAFAPPLILGLVTYLAVSRGVPRQSGSVRPGFVRSFDWGGVLLFAAAASCFVFYLSSRSITGVEPLHDWRLIGAASLLLIVFIWWEHGRENPFVPLLIFRNRMFTRTSVCASLRMFGMGGLGFLVPLYLVDIHGLQPVQLGGLLMIMPGMMALMVRLGGMLSDRVSSRLPVLIGLTVQTLSLLAFAKLPGDVSLWVIAAVLGVNGLGVGLMLAALHRAAMRDVQPSEMGAAAGIYSMIRFLGAVTGTALSGVLLQGGIDASLSTVEAYQQAFLVFAAFPVIGLLFGATLRE